MMDCVDKMFSEDELMLLSLLKGKQIQSVDACFVARENLAWNIVRIHACDHSLDVVNSLAPIEVDELGTLEEFGLLACREAPCTILEMPEVGADVTTLTLGKNLVGLELLCNRVEVFGDGRKVAHIQYPQALIFRFKDDVLVLDKEVWFSEMIAVKQGAEASDLVYDESVNWVDDPAEDPTTHFEFSRECMKLF